MKTTFVLTVFVLALGAGCIPVCPTVREARSGRVVDADSGQPIRNALVRDESYMIPAPPGCGGGEMIHAFEIRTAADGSWQVPNKSDWTIGMLVPDGMPVYVDVYCVFADGYPAEIRNPWEGWLGGESEAPRHEREMPAELRLERTSKSPAPDVGSAAPLRQITPCGVVERS